MNQQYIKFKIGEDATISLFFTRMSEDDDWVCVLPPANMKVIQGLLREAKDE